MFDVQAALEAIQRWSELHQKQSEDPSQTQREDQAYLPIVIKACYDVLAYPQGWFVDSTVNIISMPRRTTSSNARDSF